MVDQTEVPSEDTHATTKLRRFLKQFWTFLVAVPIFWTVALAVMLIGSSENMAGVLLFLGLFVIWVLILVAALAIAIYAVIKRKHLTGKLIIFGLLPLVLQIHLLAAFFAYLGADF